MMFGCLWLYVTVGKLDNYDNELPVFTFLKVSVCVSLFVCVDELVLWSVSELMELYVVVTLSSCTFIGEKQQCNRDADSCKIPPALCVTNTPNCVIVTEILSC